MYVFISENCRKEAKTFGLETKIDKIARQIERLNYHDFTNYADKFEHPFYVKKQVAYNYRLLIKVVDLEIDGKHYIKWRYFLKSLIAVIKAMTIFIIMLKNKVICFITSKIWTRNCINIYSLPPKKRT